MERWSDGKIIDPGLHHSNNPLSSNNNSKNSDNMAH